MSAAEIIELIKKLPPEERAEVNDYLNRSHVAQPDIGGQFATDADFDRAAKQVFADYHDLLRRLAQ
jgi:hypothetical protein